MENISELAIAAIVTEKVTTEVHALNFIRMEHRLRRKRKPKRRKLQREKLPALQARNFLASVPIVGKLTDISAVTAHCSKKIAKSLHCKTLNEYIDLKDSPFEIAQEARE